MLDKQRKTIEEKLNQIIAKLAELCTEKEEVKKKIIEIKTLLSEHTRYTNAKRDLLSNVTIFSLCGVAMELFIYFMSDDIFPVTSIVNEIFSFDATKWQVTHLVIPITCACTIFVTSFESLFDIIRYRESSKIDEEEQKRELELRENLSESLSQQITNLEERKNTYQDDIKYIDNLPGMVDKILSDVANLTDTGDEIPSSEEILTREFNEYLNETNEDSKGQAPSMSGIKEYKLEAHE